MLSEAKTTKNQEKNVLKTMCFLKYFLGNVFFRFFATLARFWEALEGPKISKKSKTSKKNTKRVDVGTRPILKEASGRVSGRFWEGLGKVLEGFGETF